MKHKRAFLVCILMGFLFSCGCRVLQPANPHPGIEEPLLIDGVSFRVINAAIRESYSIHYIMKYPSEGFDFCVITVEITGFDHPQVALQWGVENIRLIQKGQVMALEYSTWNLAGDDIEYTVDSDFNYSYRLIYNIPINPDPSSLYLYVTEDHLLPLSSIIGTHYDRTKKDSADQGSQDGGVSVENEFDASGQFSWIGGGSQNNAAAFHAVISGGFLNYASSAYTTISGGRENQAAGLYSTVVGGYANQASGRDSFVGGGSRNSALNYHTTIAGGIRNQAVGSDTTISGGSYNLAGDLYATVGGGTQNQAVGSGSVISGGSGNLAGAEQSVISGGLGNTVSGDYAYIGGGQGNTITGNFSVVPGGARNDVAADYAFAAGSHTRVREYHPGVFIYADSLDYDFSSQAANEYAVRSTGGVRFVSGVDQLGSPVSGVVLPAGSGSWASLSDRALKENLHSIDSHEILQKLASLPITTWNYTTQDEQIKHIGPMAQDFYDAFGAGEDNLTISSIDADGVAFSAIQALYQRTIFQEQQLERTQKRQSLLENRLRFQNILLLGFFLIILKYSGKRETRPE